MPVPDPIGPDRQPSTPEPTGAGGPIVLLLMAGTIIGFLLGQATIGFMVGAAAGAALAGTLWWRERERD